MGADGTKPIRPAASILIIRDGTHGVEVVTMKRSASMRFLPGYLSFPGGSLQEDDWNSSLDYLAGEIQNLQQSDDLAYAVAAIRETVEEIGWLAAVAGQAGDTSCLKVPFSVQSGLLNGGRTLQDILVDGDWRIDAGLLRFVGRWVTPAHMPARFDTRFFLVLGNGTNQTFSVHESENVWAKWCQPGELLAGIEKREEQAVPPTIAMLQALAKAPNAMYCFESLWVPGPMVTN